MAVDKCLQLSQFIVYACPVGELAKQLDHYFQKSLACCGPNAAHHYMPHCTLTGFFHDDEAAIPIYIQALNQTLAKAQIQTETIPQPVITVTTMTFRPDWHGLELQSDGLKRLMTQFAERADSPTRQEALRLKTWLHLSLAYDFPAEQAHLLMQLAQSLVDPQAPVAWELRFYQRHLNFQWTCHQAWPLSNL